MLKGLKSALAAVAITLGIGVIPAVAATEVSSAQVGEYFYTQLKNDNEKIIYNRLKAQADKLNDPTNPDVVEISLGGIPDSAISERVLFAFFRDHPEYFWVNGANLAWAELRPGVYKLTNKYNDKSYFYEGFTKENLPEIKAQFTAKQQEIVNAAPKDPMQAVKYFNNWLSVHNVYNPQGLGASNYSRNAAAALLSENDPGTGPVCYGYATGLKVLLDKAGIENVYVEGTAYNSKNGPSGEQHAWNYILIGGKYYAIDPTWEDPKVVNSPARLNYFLVGSETETEKTLVGKTKFGQNHDPSRSPAAAYQLNYPALNPDKLEGAVPAVEVINQNGVATAYSDLPSAVKNAPEGSVIKLWNPVTLSETLSLPENVTLDLNGQGTTRSPAVSASVAPVLNITNARIINSAEGAAVTLSTTVSSASALKVSGKVKVGANVTIKSAVSNMPAITGNHEGDLHVYEVVSANKQTYNYYPVEPLIDPENKSYTAQEGQTIAKMTADVVSGFAKLQPYFRISVAPNPVPVPADKIPDYSWKLVSALGSKETVNLADEVALKNGDYVFETNLFGYSVKQTVTVSGIKEEEKHPDPTPGDGEDGDKGEGDKGTNPNPDGNGSSGENGSGSQGGGEGTVAPDPDAGGSSGSDQGGSGTGANPDQSGGGNGSTPPTGGETTPPNPSTPDTKPNVPEHSGSGETSKPKPDGNGENSKPVTPQPDSGTKPNPGGSGSNSGKPDTKPVVTFTDTASYPFVKEINWLASTGVTTGYPDRTFRPHDSVSRAAMAAFLYRLEGKPNYEAPKQSPFKDIKPGDDFYKEICWLASKGITTGYADGTFKPWDPIARDAMAAFLHRYDQKVAVKKLATKLAAKNFTDTGATPFAKDIAWLSQTGVTTGYADGSFRPFENIERGAIAAFFYRMKH